MINEKSLIHDLLTLSQKLYKVLEVDLNEGTYFEVKTSEDERPANKEKLKQWMDDFIEEGNIHPRDVKVFSEFFNPEELKKMRNDWHRVFYRRKSTEGEWRYCCMEIVPLENYSDEDAIVILVVRDVEDYVNDFREQEMGQISDILSSLGSCSHPMPYGDLTDFFTDDYK